MWKHGIIQGNDPVACAGALDKAAEEGYELVCGYAIQSPSTIIAGGPPEITHYLVIRRKVAS